MLGFFGPLACPVGRKPDALAVGDFNGDGIDDVAVSSKRGGFVSVLLGDGIGATCPTATALGL